ncbi:MAG: MBL fold metallo-hydrolase [Boseongicola sp.]|nr:MAG: MBL fold metallo-hydrolase [Boseongicola sp.]
MQKPPVGQPISIQRDVRCLLAPNPGAMTHWGTNTYVVGTGQVAIIDPGPADPNHLDAILRATDSENISHIFVTHAHKDHCQLAIQLAEISGAPILASAQVATASRSNKAHHLGGGEGIDTELRPDVIVEGGDAFEIGSCTITAVHTPGHFAGHFAFRIKNSLFSGDHVFDWASSVISPPDGNLADFRATTRLLLGMNLERLMPGHGAAIDNPNERLNWLLHHREKRENEIVSQLKDGQTTLSAMTTRIYGSLSPRLFMAAERNVLAHLIYLIEKNNVISSEENLTRATFRWNWQLPEDQK